MFYFLDLIIHLAISGSSENFNLRNKETIILSVTNSIFYTTHNVYIIFCIYYICTLYILHIKTLHIVWVHMSRLGHLVGLRFFSITIMWSFMFLQNFVVSFFLPPDHQQFFEERHKPLTPVLQTLHLITPFPQHILTVLVDNFSAWPYMLQIKILKEAQIKTCKLFTTNT